MRYTLFFIFAGIGTTCLLFCKKDHGVSLPFLPFDSVPVSRTVHPIIEEISGIADSKRNPGRIWAQEDSGNPPVLILIRQDGTVEKKIYLEGIPNRDWEDMVLFDNQIFIGETGDNAGIYSDYKIYYFPEPSMGSDTVRNIQSINFTYPDGSHDVEAFIIDPVTKNIYLITKRDTISKIYQLSFPYTSNQVVNLVGTLPFNGVVGSAISPDGGEIVLKTYAGLAYYKRTLGESVISALQKKPLMLHYVLEPQGEAICFAQDNTGFFTASEKGFANHVLLYFYRRK